jgi:hypothetical protein
MMKKMISFFCIIACIAIGFMSCSLDENENPGDPTPSPTPGPIPETPDIAIDPDITELFINSTALLTASGSGSDVTYEWSVTGGGSLSPATGTSVTYTSPSMPGPVTITCVAVDAYSQTSPEALISLNIFDMTDTVLWLDCMNTGSLEFFTSSIFDGQGIRNWSDLSGNDNHAAKGTNYPIYRTSQITNNATIAFYQDSEPDDYPSFIVSESNTLTSINNITFFIIAKQTAATGTSSQTLIEMDAGLSVAANVDSTVFSFTVNDESSVSFSNTDILDYAVISGVYNSDTGQQTVWIDGVVADTTTYDQVLSCSGDLHIGGIDQDNVLHGYIGEIVVFNKAINDAQIEYISSYLSGKWGMFLGEEKNR